jgi:hypothetical protein
MRRILSFDKEEEEARVEDVQPKKADPFNLGGVLERLAAKGLNRSEPSLVHKMAPQELKYIMRSVSIAIHSVFIRIIASLCCMSMQDTKTLGVLKQSAQVADKSAQNA